MNSTDSPTTAYLPTPHPSHPHRPWPLLGAVIVAVLMLIACMTLAITKHEKKLPPVWEMTVDTQAEQLAKSGESFVYSDFVREHFEPQQLIRRGYPAGISGAGDVYVARGGDDAFVLLPQKKKAAIRNGIMWEKFYDTTLPVSTDAGPTKINEEGLPVGWARSPKGAILAATSMLAYSQNLAGFYTSREKVESALKTIMQPVEQEKLNRFFSTFTAETIIDTDHSPSVNGWQETNERNWSGPSLYEVKSYTKKKAVITLYLASTVRGQRVFIPVDYTLRWYKGDWRLAPETLDNWVYSYTEKQFDEELENLFTLETPRSAHQW